MRQISSIAIACLTMHHIACLAAFGAPAAAQLELSFRNSGRTSEQEVMAALSTELDAALGKGPAAHFGDAGRRLAEISGRVSAMYESLPKDASGKLSHQAVRYALHRYFLRHHGWFVRGLEPRNDTWHGSPDPSAHNSSAMKEWVPSYLQDILELMVGQSSTDLLQLSAFAASLQDLIWMEASQRLGTAYEMYGYSRMRPLTRADVDSLVSTYYVAFLNSWDFTAGTQEEAEQNVQAFIGDYDGWPRAKLWLSDISAINLRVEGDGFFHFEGVAPTIRKMHEEYYQLNDVECRDLKETLRGIEGRKAGRVRLSAFYHKGMYSHWEFSEKKEYLRKLGALDESNPRHPTVIIANYAMARPNCLDASNLYAICCRNDCEDLLDNLERRIKSSSATSEEIARLISAPEALLQRLDQIAQRHGGRVPLHSRLFAQWMHHVYPLDCPYPHELGSVSPLSRNEWIKESGQASERASLEERSAHIARDACHVDEGGGLLCAEEEDSSELPWSDKEELVAEPPASQGLLSDVAILALMTTGAGLVACSVISLALLCHARTRRMEPDASFFIPEDRSARDGFGLQEPIAKFDREDQQADDSEAVECSDAVE